MAKRVKNCCESELARAIDKNPALGPTLAQDGDKWTCPNCKLMYEHVCYEAEGCSWMLYVLLDRRKVRKVTA